MNTPVSFELAKLLKEKGFEERTKSYTEDGKLVTISLTIRRFNLEKVYYPSPTIAEVVMWLYEKHGIWIEVRHIKTFNVNRFHVIIWDYKDTSDYMTIHCDNGVGYEVWDSLTEAYEAAIEYTLNKLI